MCVSVCVWMLEEAMTKAESRRSMAGAEPVHNGPVEPGSSTMRAVLKQSSRENLHRKNTECEVYDDGTNTFFWCVCWECAGTSETSY